MNKIYILLLSLLASISLSHGKDYFGKSHSQATGRSPSSLSLAREDDVRFLYVDPTCCCNNDILDIFEEDTENTTKRVNPATDYLILSLTMLNEKIDLKIKQVKNYRMVNGLYSFADRNNAYNRYGNTTPITSSPVVGSGCKPMDFNEEEDREWYQKNVIDVFEAGGGYSQEGYVSNAFGRYQFMPTTGAQYCQQAPSSLGCCGGTWSNKNGKTFGGGEWRTGANAQACQDAMFTSFTQDNASSLANYGIPQNSCTVYLAHQQGIGGLNWLMGGSLPSDTSLETMKNRVRLNIGKDWDKAVAEGKDLNNEAVLRQVYVDFWSRKMGGDILNGAGNIVPIKDIAEQAEKFATLKVERDQFYREGILFELYRQKEEIKSILDNFATQAIDKPSNKPAE